VLREVEKPSFTCTPILSVNQEVFSSTTLEIAKFISEYYVCSMGEALGLFTPLKQLESNKPFKSELTPKPLSRTAKRLLNLS